MDGMGGVGRGKFSDYWNLPKNIALVVRWQSALDRQAVLANLQENIET